MDNAMLAVVNQIINHYGDAVFGNTPRTNAMLLDLAPSMMRERILVRNFIEMGGYELLKKAGREYPIIRSQLIRTLTDTFCLEFTAAEWVVRLFAAALGYENTEIPTITHPSESSVPKTAVHFMSLVAIGKAHTVAVATDGTVFAHGRNDRFECDVSNWRQVVAVAAGDNHTVGLLRDGTVLTAGSNTYDQCDVGHLTGIASVYAFGNDTVCVKADGTATAAGRSGYDLSHFEDVKQVSWFPEGLFGIRRDGTVAVAGEIDHDAPSEMPEVGWAVSLTDAIQIISTYTQGSIVLKTDGRIYKMNEPDNYFAQWRDIISAVDLSDYFAILRADGTVRILSYDRNRPHLVTQADGWRDIVAIYGKYKRLIGLTKDAGLLAVCTDPDWIRRNGSLDYVTNWYPIGG